MIVQLISTNETARHCVNSPSLAPKELASMRPQFTAIFAARFWSKVVKAESCWLWTGATSNGYGKVTCRARASYPLFAHRVAYELEVGAIPDGYEVDHLCRNPRCVNPAHLEAVPPRVNNLRSDSAAAKHARQTHCKRGHEFTPENTYVQPAKPNSRRCRACAAESELVRVPKRKAARHAAKAERHSL